VRLLLSGLLPVFGLLSVTTSAFGEEGDELFRARVAPLFSEHCYRCHNDSESKGGLSLESEKRALAGGESGAVIDAGDPQSSYLLDLVTPTDGRAALPKEGQPLTAEQIATLRDWIAAGAKWPADVRVEEPVVRDTDWWSLRPILRPELPQLSRADAAWTRTPIDAFIRARQRQEQLAPSAEADKRTLIRWLYFDLIGLPPTPAEVATFLADEDPRAYQRLVDRLLASPRYGERWARHWLDIVHYGDTHGYDKDKPRPNAWPYRDYVIRALNEDKPYARFVQEQLAGDVLYPGTRDGIVALGFIAAGPWDYVGHAELPETKIDGQIARNLDRDDMVTTTMNTFVSLTVQCARCHNHKFDPVTQEDYYSLQAVFAALDRADRPYDASPAISRERATLEAQLQRHRGEQAAIAQQIADAAGEELPAIDGQLAGLDQRKKGAAQPEFGYHSQIAQRPDVKKWVQLDLGKSQAIEEIVYVGCHDTFAGIGAGFGFPVRYRIELSDDPEFSTDVFTVVDATAADVENPGVVPQSVSVGGHKARYVRITATRLAERSNDYIFALGEVQVLAPGGVNIALNQPVTALDSIEAPVRWRKSNLVDGYYYGRPSAPDTAARIARLTTRRKELLANAVPVKLHQRSAELERQLQQTQTELDSLPPQRYVYAGTIHHGRGAFRGTGHNGGQPRVIRLLHRGDIRQPRQVVAPGTVDISAKLPARFDLPAEHDEAARRVALARWLVDRDNPLLWRSIVNRIWQYHFGRGLVDTPNDFGRMGSKPTHPELLDWLAADFRDNGQSLKRLHRLIVTSAVYRQSSAHDEAHARRDGANRFLWRMNRQRLEAEVIRDSVLAVSDKLDASMGGPGFKAFGFKNDHSPHYKYREYDPDDPATHRRAIYRFIVRSVPDPFMETLDCADPSQLVPKRVETLTALQALSLLNNKFMIRMSEHFASHLAKYSDTPEEQIRHAFQLALARQPAVEELETVVRIAREHGLASACRLIFNLNEFVFVD